jgi:hypothetical protein
MNCPSNYSATIKPETFTVTKTAAPLFWAQNVCLVLAISPTRSGEVRHLPRIVIFPHQGLYRCKCDSALTREADRDTSPLLQKFHSPAVRIGIILLGNHLEQDVIRMENRIFAPPSNPRTACLCKHLAGLSVVMPPRTDRRIRRPMNRDHARDRSNMRDSASLLLFFWSGHLCCHCHSQNHQHHAFRSPVSLIQLMDLPTGDSEAFSMV